MEYLNIEPVARALRTGTESCRCHITVAICTRNRRDSIRAAIDALKGSTAHAADVEVLVVDNGSDDGTAEFVRGIASEWESGRLRLVEEPEPGLSHARNRALQESDAEVVAYIDDDSVVSGQWLDEIRRMFTERPEAGVVGGPIRVQWLDEEPDWLHSDLLSYFSGLDYGAEDCRLTYPRSPYGANFCVRRDVALQVGGFRTDLGYTGTSLIGGEETELARRVEGSGWQVWYCANASVLHLISGKRASLDWLSRRAYTGGLTDTKLRKERIQGLARILLFLADARWLRYAICAKRTAVNRTEEARNKARYSHALGRFRGWWT